MSRSYTHADIFKSLYDAGLRCGDTVFVTTSLGMLGVPEGIESGEDLNRLFFEILKEFIGPAGNVIVPTYSYTFGGSTASELQVFDPETTPAGVGPFPEFFRHQPGVIRSLDPMMSAAGFGPHIEELFRDLPPTSYGADCLFARLAQIPAKCCSIGLGPNWMPFIHHTDWLCKVPFRYDKLFKGQINTASGLCDSTWLYSVRLSHDASRATGHKVAKLAVEEGIWQYAPLGRARVYVADYRRYFDFTIQQLGMDPWITAFGPPGDPTLLDQERISSASNIDIAPGRASLEEVFLAYANYHRVDVSDTANSLLECLAPRRNFQLASFRTGENHLDWVIPEKWDLKTATISDERGQCIFAKDDLMKRVYAYSLSRSQSLSKAELFHHIKQYSGCSESPKYWNAVLNRDWGFSLSGTEWKNIPDIRLNVEIETFFSFGIMKIAATDSPDSGKPLILIVGYVNGPAGGKDLLSAFAAIELHEKLCTSSAGAQNTYILLLLPGPAGFAAWLNTHSHLRAKIAGVFELAQIESQQKIEILLPENFSHNSLVRFWSESGHGFARSFRNNSCSYLLTPGGNPVAGGKISDIEFPILSLGNRLAMENSSESVSRKSPYAQLLMSDFAAASEVVSTFAAIQRQFQQE